MFFLSVLFCSFFISSRPVLNRLIGRLIGWLVALLSIVICTIWTIAFCYLVDAFYFCMILWYLCITNTDKYARLSSFYFNVLLLFCVSLYIYNSFSVQWLCCFSSELEPMKMMVNKLQLSICKCIDIFAVPSFRSLKECMRIHRLSSQIIIFNVYINNIDSLLYSMRVLFFGI